MREEIEAAEAGNAAARLEAEKEKELKKHYVPKRVLVCLGGRRKTA